MSNTVIEGVDYGPLAALVGTWSGDKGMDISPEPEGQEDSAYYETLFVEAIGEVGNAHKQTLAALRYHQVVHRKSNNEVFHNETGYWMWDAAAQLVIKTVTIPRGVAIVAGGKGDSGSIQVEAKLGDTDFSISQQPFMRDAASTKEYRQSIDVVGNELRYEQHMLLDIYGREFDHKDSNTLQRN